MKYRTAEKKSRIQLRHFIISALLLTAPMYSVADNQDYSLFKIELIMAQKGDPEAQFNVAHAYEEGTGIKRDVKQALYWYRKAAAQGHDFAQYSLGLFYEQGLGVNKDQQQARKWYTLAAKNGNKLAKQKLLPPPAPSRPVAKPIPKTLPKPTSVAKRKSPPPPRAKPKPTPTPPRPLDTMNLVLRGKWSFHGTPADYLPSSATRCLPRGHDEIICFTPELKRLLDGSQITYTTKASIKNFTKEGKFSVDYLYNVTDIRAADKPGPKQDPHGLQKQEGWQPHHLRLQCTANPPRRLSCIRGKTRYTFQQARRN